MAELADAPDLGSGGTLRAGSSPVIRSKNRQTPTGICRFPFAVYFLPAVWYTCDTKATGRDLRRKGKCTNASSKRWKAKTKSMAKDMFIISLGMKPTQAISTWDIWKGIRLKNALR